MILVLGEVVLSFGAQWTGLARDMYLHDPTVRNIILTMSDRLSDGNAARSSVAN